MRSASIGASESVQTEAISTYLPGDESENCGHRTQTLTLILLAIGPVKVVTEYVPAGQILHGASVEV